MGPEGLEQSGLAGSGGPIPEDSGAKCGAHSDALAAIAADPRLARVVGEWGRLSEGERVRLVAMVEAWSGEGI